MNKRLYVFNGDGLTNKNQFGIQRYEYHILKELDSLIDTKSVAVELLIPQNKYCKINFKNIRIVKAGTEKNGWLSKNKWQQITFPRYLLKHKATGIDMTLALPMRKCEYVTLHDCIVEAFQENYVNFKEKLSRKIYLYKVERICRGKHTILTLSQESKNEIIKYHNVNPDKIKLVSCGWEHMKRIKPDFSFFDEYSQLTGENFFFSLGSKYRHKNFEWVLKVARNHPQYYFVISGANYFSVSAKKLESSYLKNVIFTSYISDEQVKALMLRCKALIQPSIYEGFGLPPLEALSLGRKIIVANASCMSEIYGESAYYIDPYSYGIDLDKLLEEPVSDGQEVLQKYTWKNAAKQLVDIIF